MVVVVAVAVVVVVEVVVVVSFVWPPEAGGEFFRRLSVTSPLHGEHEKQTKLKSQKMLAKRIQNKLYLYQVICNKHDLHKACLALPCCLD